LAKFGCFWTFSESARPAFFEGRHFLGRRRAIFAEQLDLPAKPKQPNSAFFDKIFPIFSDFVFDNFREF
jgi:hypothetical protein